MMNAKWKSGLSEAWQSMSESLSQGWHELREEANSALTRFRHKPRDGRARHDGQEPPMPAQWGFLAADVFEDDDCMVVRLEAPGMKRDDFQIELRDGRLLVHGNKQFQSESARGAYHMVQCAYGSFLRELPLAVPVQPDKASASYRDGVLRIELPKDKSAKRQRISVQVH